MPRLMPADAGSLAKLLSAFTEPSQRSPIMLPERSCRTMMFSVFWLASAAVASQAPAPPTPAPPPTPTLTTAPPVPLPLPPSPPAAPAPELATDAVGWKLVVASSSVDALQPAQVAKPTSAVATTGTETSLERRRLMGL